VRAFIAVDLPEALRDALEEVQDGLPGRHVAGDNLHVTLAFLGEVDEARLRELHERLDELALMPPELSVTGLDVFGGRKPNLCFASVERNNALEEAQRAVAGAARAAGVDLRRERFRPHVTLSRFGRTLALREERQLAERLGILHLPKTKAESFSLYQSDLRPEGPVYSVLARYDFD